MSHIIQTFGDWKKINEEDDVPGRERQKGKSGNKIVYIPIDKQTLKLKIVNETDIIDAEGKLRVTRDGVHAFDELLRLIKGQSEIISYYPDLNDLVNNIVIYDIEKDRGSSKQVIIFRIASKSQLTEGDINKRINPRVRYVRSDELRRAMEGALINVDQADQIVSDQNVKAKFKLPFSAASITGSTDANLKQFIVDAYNIVKKDPKIGTTHKIMKRVKDETKAGTLGVASKLFIKALNASLIIKGQVGLLDAVYKEDVEENITQTLYDFIMNAKKALGESTSFYLGLDGDRIFEAESDVIPGFDTDAFIAVANTITPETGDIKVPDNGFTFGMKADAELAKFQKLLYTKLKKLYAGSQSYINFAAKTGDGKAGSPVGNYDKTTAALVATLKKELNNPIWPERDGNTISADFVKRMQDELKSIKESSKPFVYLGLDGKTVIINEDLGVPDDKVVSKPAVKTQAKPAAKSSGSSNVGGVVGPLLTNKIATDGKGSGARYKVVNGQWYYMDTLDKSDTWGLLRSPKWIAAAMAEFPNHGGHYLRMKNVGKTASGNDRWSGMDKSAEVTGYIRKDNKWYMKPVNGAAVEVPPNSQVAIDLDNLYVKTRYVSGTPSSSGVATTAAKIDADIVALGNSIKQFVEDGANFKAYANLGFWGNDDENQAWKNVLLPRWKSVWKPKVSTIRQEITASSLINSTDKARYETSLQTIEGMFRDPDRNTSARDFLVKFLGGSGNDVYELQLLLSVAGKNSDKITIDTDYEYDE